jgi:hypothetical protein
MQAENDAKGPTEHALPSLPVDLLGHIYSFLKWEERLLFLLISKQIHSTSILYRDMRFSQRFTEEYALNQNFRERVQTLSLPPNVRFHLSVLSPQLTDEAFSHLGRVAMLTIGNCSTLIDDNLRHFGRVHTLSLTTGLRITDVGLSHLGSVQSLSLRSFPHITDTGVAHLSHVHTLRLIDCPRVTDAVLYHLSGVRIVEIHRWCRVCCNHKMNVVEAMCEVCRYGRTHALRYECHRCHRHQTIPHPMWRYQPSFEENSTASWACHVGCGDYTHWRVIAEDVSQIPREDIPETWDRGQLETLLAGPPQAPPPPPWNLADHPW